jgi:hypothetical protein
LLLYQSRTPRQITDLQWARLGDSPFSPGKSYGSRKAGLTFERAVFKKVGKVYPMALHNPWIAFADANGSGFACPDIVVPSARLLIEVKLSYTPLAIPQIEDLYLPLVEALWGASPPWKRLIVVKYWKGPAPEVLLSSLDEGVAGRTLPLLLR